MHSSFKTGITLLYISVILMGLGGIGDILITIINRGMVPSHLAFLQLEDSKITEEMIGLTHSLLRALGGSLLALGIASWYLLSTLLKKGSKSGLLAIVFIITLAEGNNAWQMTLVDSKLFVFPLFIVLMSWLGAILLWRATKEQDKK
jgi:hypothetical protein